MELEVRGEGENRKVCWIKADGTASRQVVSKITELECLEFPIPSGPGDGYCRHIEVLLGDPYADTRLVVTAGGHTWYGSYVLDQETYEYERLAADVRPLIAEGKVTLDNVLEVAAEVERKRKPPRIAARRLAKAKRLVVLEQEDGYYVHDKKAVVRNLPKDWAFLPSGDAALTHAVQNMGPYWVVKREHSEGWRRAGICCPTQNKDQAAERLGGTEGANSRAQAKLESQMKREDQVTEMFEVALREEFPRMPEDDIFAIIGQARRPGKVGKAQNLYFSTTDMRPAAFRVNAELAAEAHARHAYTKYEELLANGAPKDLARAEIRYDVDAKLREWRGEDD